MNLILLSIQENFQQAIRNQTHVSITLANYIFSKKSPKSNIVFSPLSLHIVLAIIAACSGGQTLDQLLGFLKINTVDDLNSLYSKLVSLVIADGSPSGGPLLSFANGVWVDQTLSFKPSFKQLVDTVYNAVSNQVDFMTKADEVANKVNLWAEKQTNGLIKDLLPADAVNNFCKLIFANALYFKADWSQEFDQSKTKNFDFHLVDGSKVRVPFMTTSEMQFVRKYAGFKVLGLPYLPGKGETRFFNMYFFLPDANDGLPSLIEKIGSTSDFLDRCIPRTEVEIGRFLIPKFKISFGFEASDTLKELGLVFPFSDKEGLTEMVDSSVGGNLYVSSIHHKSFVEVNEEGTEAAYASAFLRRIGCSAKYRPESYKVDFVADHPFLFVIREDLSRVVLFMGQVLDPSV